LNGTHIVPFLQGLCGLPASSCCWYKALYIDCDWEWPIPNHLTAKVFYPSMTLQVLIWESAYASWANYEKTLTGGELDCDTWAGVVVPRVGQSPYACSSYPSSVTVTAI
jgi:hypothetical protein